MNLRPLDLDATELRARRLLGGGDVVQLSDSRFVIVLSSEFLRDELVGYRGDIIRDPFGIGYPVPADPAVIFEPNNVADLWRAWEFDQLVERWWINVERSRRAWAGGALAPWDSRTRPGLYTERAIEWMRAGNDPHQRSERYDVAGHYKR